MIKITIDNHPIECLEGQTILEAARSHNIYIPAICYLTGCSPTVACKMCMAEMDGKRVYTCNAKVKDNAEIFTQTPELLAEKKAIMQTYDVNHPLECGVCDKSGECELQDLTLRMRVESQHFSVQDDPKESKHWAQTIYDPNLCIMCERCVTTCKDNLGESNLKAVKTELHSPDSFKDSMPKDPFSVWSRKQKALIDFVGETPCFDCGECISVCPVGALGYKDFSYTANAWELQKISSTCQHCAAGCFINYEVRHQDILGEQPKIFRVSNNFNHNPICGAGRFAFDTSSSTQGSQNLLEARIALQKATAVRIGGNITNEEAYLIEGLRQKLGFKLYCEESRKFQEFSHILSQDTPQNLSAIKNTDLIITLGSAIKTENPRIRYAINNTLKLNKSSSLIYAHPIKDALIERLGRNVLPIYYAPQADEIILGAIFLSLNLNPNDCLKPLLQTQKTLHKTIAKTIKKTLPPEGDQPAKEISEKVDETIEIPYYAMFEEIGLPQETYEKFSALLNSALVSPNAPVLIIGQDIYTHPKAKNIAALLAYLQQNTPIKIILIPPQTNSVGISLICALDNQNTTCDKEKSQEYIVGIRTKGDFTMDSDQSNAKGKPSKEVDFILPALNQIEGTLTNFEHRLLPLKNALPFEGYDLSDIAQGFGFSGESLIDYTHLLPTKAGYQPTHFDTLKNFYARSGEDKRGYLLSHKQSFFEQTIPEGTQNHQDNHIPPQHIKDLEDIAGAICPITPISPIVSNTPNAINAYLKYPQNQFETTITSQNLQTKIGIYTSKNHLETLGLKQGDIICLTKDNREIKSPIYIDEDMQQDIFVISPCLDEQNIFKDNIFQHLTRKECL
ncbi:NADH-quinone oxidoreductase subunit G [Helicobacter sp. 11S02596-1]|uniref:NADH-quinone oxidoreductase subunit G n=1 Tax=Helicobacter sp. 11S02596-1 TaxID=1476194 RepID=UPI000BA4FC14|nr:NADH-quinone oxidoreductase subunit G [Helicobacter sp. 11S02596-1]PAF44283.1 NADH dehydrogenase [Helicobacter sp. 11S02596-1]